MTRVPKPSDPTQYYTCSYDAWNRLVKVEQATSTVAEYAYDGAKRRTVKKTYCGGELDETRHFYYTEPSRWQVVEERVGTSSDPDRQFVWGLRYIDDRVLRDRDTDSNGTLDERVYALQDANWNVTTLAGGDGSIQERYAYDPYGSPMVLTPTFGSRAGSHYTWETRFAAYRWDTEARFYQVRNRTLVSKLGWLQRDPVGLAAGLNLYAYVHARPTIHTDPSGELILTAVVLGSLGASQVGAILAWLGIGLAALMALLLASQAIYIPDEVLRCRRRRRRRGRWHCTTKPRGNCPPNCQTRFHGYGFTRSEAKAESEGACQAAGCHTPGGQPFSCNCGHTTCRQEAN